MAHNNHFPHGNGNHYAAETAGSLMVRHVPTAFPSATVAGVTASLQGKLFDSCDTIYVLDDRGRLAGIVPIARLYAARPEDRIEAILRSRVTSVTADTDQERVASLAIIHGLTAVPVTDDEYRLIGVVPPPALYSVLRHEHVEDLHRLAGIRRENHQAQNAIEAPPMRRVRDRLPWLLVGLAGSVLATGVVAWFESELQSKLAIAFFVPGIVYLADAIGTQTEAIAVRGLSLSHEPIGNLIWGELRTGFIIGLVLGALSLPMIWVVFGDFYLGLSVALALVAAGMAASTIGLVFPWLLAKLGKDPALGSGPIATIVQDLLSLVIYFGIAATLVL